MKRKTHEEYENDLFLKEIDCYPTERYITSRIPIEHECLLGHLWKARPNDILSGKGCPKCNYKRDNLSYLHELASAGITNIEVLDTYKGRNTKIRHKCSEGHIWNTLPSTVLAGKGCAICNKQVLKSTEVYEQELIKFGITCLDTYVNRITPIKHKCVYGHVWKATPGNILKGSGCPSCSTHGFDNSAPAILYYIKIGNYYKIGITNRTITERFYPDRHLPITVLKEIAFSSGELARLEETRLLKLVTREKGLKYLLSGGNTELFKEPLCLSVF